MPFKEGIQHTDPIDFIKPYEQQYDWSCGAASLFIVYRALGLDISEDQLYKELDTDEDGTRWEEMVNHPAGRGFRVWNMMDSNYNLLLAAHNGTRCPIIVNWFSPKGRDSSRLPLFGGEEYGQGENHYR